MSETHVGQSQVRIITCVRPGTVVRLAIAAVPVLADDELGGNLLA